jgi:hypothetical protein
LTLQGAGLFHIAMGAVLGIAAFGRTQEKLNGANNGGIQTTTPTTGFTSGATTPSAPSAGGFGAPSTSFTPAPSWGTTNISAGSGGSTGFGATTSAPAGVTTGFGGKPAPVMGQDPII